MKEVRFRLIPETSIAQFHFVVTQRRGWYDENIQPVVDFLIDNVPPVSRRHVRETCTWEIHERYWPTVLVLFETMGFTITKEPDELREGFRGFARELAGVQFVAAFGLALMLLFNFLAHLFNAHTVAVRPFFTLLLLLIFCLSVRFKSYKLFFFAGCLIVLFNPLYPIHLGNWWLWQPINWMTTLFVFGSGLHLNTMAEDERKLELWWLSL